MAIVFLPSNNRTEIAASFQVPGQLRLPSEAFGSLTCLVTLKGNLPTTRIHGRSRCLEAVFASLRHSFILWSRHNTVASLLLARSILEPGINYPLCTTESAALAAIRPVFCADPRWSTLGKLRSATYLAAPSFVGQPPEFTFKTFGG